MAALTVTEWVSMATAVIGTVVAVLTLYLQQRDRRLEVRVQRAAERVESVDRWEHDEIARAQTDTDAEHARTEAARRRTAAQEHFDSATAALPVKRRRRSYKAVAAVVLGALSLLGGLSLVGAAEATGEPVTTGEAGATLFYAAIALVLGLSARRDIKGDPGRRGMGMAVGGVVCAVVGALVLAGSASQDSTTTGVPQDTSANADAPTGETPRQDLSAIGQGPAQTAAPTAAVATVAPAEAGDVTGTWSGTLADEAGTGEQESIRLDIVSFDGFEDGTMTTVLGDDVCEYVLAHQAGQDGAEVFTASDSAGTCGDSAVGVQLDASGDLIVREQFQGLDGSTRSFSGQISRG